VANDSGLLRWMPYMSRELGSWVLHYKSYRYAFCNNYKACVDVAYRVLLNFTLDVSCVPCMFHESHDQL
jgi:hypothetical protein